MACRDNRQVGASALVEVGEREPHPFVARKIAALADEDERRAGPKSDGRSSCTLLLVFLKSNEQAFVVADRGRY